MINSRKDYERNLYVLLEKMEQGKVVFPYEMERQVEGLLNTRKAQNGRVDFTTVDEQARSLANSIAMMTDHPDFPTTDKESSSCH